MKHPNSGAIAVLAGSLAALAWVVFFIVYSELTRG